jgi:hypothetical protein
VVGNLMLMFQLRGCSGGNLRCCCSREGVVVGNLMLMVQRGCSGGNLMLIFQRGCSGGKFNAVVAERVLWRDI